MITTTAVIANCFGLESYSLGWRWVPSLDTIGCIGGKSMLLGSIKNKSQIFIGFLLQGLIPGTCECFPKQ